MYTKNNLFFNTWSPEMAWVSGFIAADGCIVNCGRNYAIVINLQERDKDVLEKIAALLNYNGPIRRIDKKPTKLVPNPGHQFNLRIYSNELCFSLMKIGICQRKSLNMNWINSCPKDLISHFARGYWDGDGSIYQSKGGSRITAYALGTMNFLNGIKEEMPMGSIYTHHSNPHIYRLMYNGSNCLELCDWLYQDSYNEIRMNRKYLEYQKIISLGIRRRSEYLCPRGVNYNSRINKYIAYYHDKNRKPTRVCIGSYDTAEEAAFQRDLFLIQNNLWGKNRPLNNPSLLSN